MYVCMCVLSENHTIHLNFTPLGSDVSAHFFWSEYRVNQMRFHSLRNELSLYWS